MPQIQSEENPELLFEEGKRFYCGARDGSCDPDLALNLFYRAARLGYAPAQRLLGITLMEGTICDKDPEKALFWLAEAARHNDPQAALSLAIMYAKGEGTDKKWDRAYQLLSAPGVENLPEARELKIKLKESLMGLYPKLSEALALEERTYRLSLNSTQTRFILPFWPSGSKDDSREFSALLDLNLGKKTIEETFHTLRSLMHVYYTQALSSKDKSGGSLATP
ncbi:MAG: sel1 repeat family protein [Deltaproteobacteria bacterium]|jgi:hypothetical protein|nr:sel1 repeat family protein [Deltaproteobacteria bacterium]